MKKIIILIVFSLLIIILQNSNKISKTTSLFGVNLVIDPGHGGKDNGTCFNEVLEDELNLEIATKLMNICIEDGAIASLTRVSDYDLASLYAKNRKNEDLRKRVEFINNSGAQYFISIHINSYPSDTKVNGPMVYYDKNDAESKKMATEVANSLNKFANQDKQIHYDDFYLFRKTSVPGILIECGFISNTNERNKLCNENYQAKFAKVVYDGINNFLLGIRV